MEKLPKMTPEEVSQFRKAMGWSQGRAANELGVVKRTIQKWEGNERKCEGPVVLLIKKICADEGISLL